jgi:hypothetical protein
MKKPKVTITASSAAVAPSEETLELAHALKITDADDFALAEEIWNELNDHPIVKAHHAISQTLNVYDPDCPYYVARVDMEKIPKRYLTVLHVVLWRDILWEVKKTGAAPNIAGVTIRKDPNR